ncbi:hypothetical protein [Methylobacterium sp. 37f]|uniref:hypothetical protein n=1 Tax=Methylobacterium sp. 37f TaxID=2817058 RepID=UPI001FFC5573|nr:hypothetical protein [Methylobacterium sp. 37f]MCK2054023.1 hypothetical protein [Methylobacterium sp. 37f]
MQGWEVPKARSAFATLWAAVSLAGGQALLPSGAQAQTLPTAAENLTPGDLDSEHLFGFTEGSDLGVPGEAELEWETSGRLGKRLGRFVAIDSGLALKVPLTSNVRLAPGITFNAYEIDVPGHPARLSGGPAGAFLETRLRLLDRRTGPFGLTLNIVPSYSAVDSGSGARARSVGTEIGLLADYELIPGRLVAALNATVAFASTRLDAGDDLALASGTEWAGALAYQVQPGLFVGGEARYARTYDGLTLGRLAGQAVYLGPTLYTTLSPHAWASVTWSFQVAGTAIAEPGPLDLTNFDRHQMRLRVGYSF